VDKLNMILGLSDIRINDKRYVKEQGSELTIEGEATYTLMNTAATLLDYSATDAIDSDNLFVSLANISILPLAIKGVSLSSGAQVVPVFTGVIIEDLVDAAAKVAALNATLLTPNNLKGTFSIVADEIVYQNGVGENFSQIGNTPGGFTTNHLDLTADLAAGLHQTDFNLRGGWVLVDWGNAGAPTLSSVPFVTMQHTVSNVYGLLAATYNIRVFMSAGVNWFISTNPYGSTTLTNIAGVTSALQRFQVYNANIPVLNTSFLRNTYPSLTSLELFNCGITSLVDDLLNEQGTSPDGIFGYFGFGYPYVNFSNLAGINLQNNAIPAADLEQFLVSFYGFINIPTFGVLYIKQTPAVVPAGGLLVVVNYLINQKGWYVEHN
jgi:hypothetical protein